VEEHQERAITQAELEVWLNSQATKTYLQCLRWSEDQIREIIGNGGCVAATADESFGLIHSAMGQRLGFNHALDVNRQFTTHGMLVTPKENEPDGA
jgi:hypothetical protein